MNSCFQISVITDEITQDFARALEIASQEFGLQWIELRSLWNKNILALDSAEIAEVLRLLQRHNLRVTDIASPLFKVDWPDAPLSKFSPVDRGQSASDFTFRQQDDVLNRSLELARIFDTTLVRCFDFWRLEDQTNHRQAMDAMLSQAAEHAGKHGITLILENEHECNTATSEEVIRTLSAVSSPHFCLNWDPGNAVMLGDTPFPGGYERLPKHRIAHVHCKNAERGADGVYRWAPVGNGLVEWAAQFRALKRDGYQGAVSLETHWRGAGTSEDASRECWKQMQKDLRTAGALL